MEFVAAVASVAQLTRYAIYLIAAVCEIQEKIERRPVLVDQQVEQLTRLRSTIESINQNEALGTSVVREILEAIIKRISFLHLLLKKEIEKQARGFLRKYYEAYIGGDRTEKRIVDIFGDLEKDKISLLLSIAEIHAGLSSRIHTTLTEGFSSGKGEDSPNKATRSHSEAVMCKEVPANSSAKMSAEKSAQVNNAATSANPPTEKECQSGHETPNPELSSTHNRKSHETEGLDISTHSSPSSENMQAREHTSSTEESNPLASLNGHYYVMDKITGNAHLHQGSIRISSKEAKVSLRNTYKIGFMEGGRITQGEVYGAEKFWDSFYR